MNPWPFVIAAYAATLLAVTALGLWSLIAMQRAERDASGPQR